MSNGATKDVINAKKKKTSTVAEKGRGSTFLPARTFDFLSFLVCWGPLPLQDR